MNIKQSMLCTGLFYDNEYLDKYIDIIINHKTESGSFTNKHHILPRAYFKRVNLPTDNSDDNIVKLSYTDHIVAHYYLCLATKDSSLRTSMLFAFHSMTREKIQHFDTSKLTEYDSLYKEWCNRNSQLASNRQRVNMSADTKHKIAEAATGRYKDHIWIHNGTTTKHINPADLNRYKNMGFIEGRNDLETYRKISESQRKNPNRSMLNKHQTEHQKSTVSAKLKGVRKSETSRLHMRQARSGKILISNDNTRESFYISVGQFDIFATKGFHRGRLTKI